MRKGIAALAMGALLAAQTAHADASYQTTSQVTGGTLVDSVKSMAFIRKEANDLTAPTNTLVLVHGNQKATVRKDSVDIIDLDAGTMIHIDKVKKTYSVITFDDLRKMMAKMPQLQQQQQAQLKQAQQAPPPNFQMSFDVQLKDTGVTKEINGLMATEHIMTLTMKVAPPAGTAAATATQPAGSTDSAPAAGSPGSTPQTTSVAYTITTDIWIAPDPPQVQEIHDFDMRMAKKMLEGVDTSALVASWKANANAANGTLFAGQPGAADAMKRMGEELAKLKGTHVLEVTTMGGYGTGPSPAGSAAPGQASTPNSNSNQGQSAASQVAQGTAEGTAQGESSRFGVVGTSVTNSVISVFHRKKKQQQQQQAQQTAQAAPPAAATTQTTQSTVLMETTTQESNFSSDPIPPSVFQIPAGYKRVPSGMER